MSLRKVRLQHSMLTHHLPLYFPEAERYPHCSGAEWFTDLLLFTPCPTAVRQYTNDAFVAAARVQVACRKVDRARWLADFYGTACRSIGLPVAPDSDTIRMFRVVLEDYRALCLLRNRLEADAVTRLADQPDFVRLQTLPGVGPILAMTILAEASDLRRFGCNAAVSQVLRVRSLYGTVGSVSRDHAPVEARERTAPVRFGWRVRSPSGCTRIRFTASSKTTSARIRRTRTAVGKRTRWSRPKWLYAVITTGIDYRRFPEAARPGGRIPSPRAVEALATS